MISEVEDSSTHWEFKQITTRREDKHLIFVEFHLKLFHRFQTIGMLQHITDAREPLIKTRFALHAFIAPVGGDTTFGNLVHPFGSDLYFHPFLFRTEYGDMQRLIAIRLGYRQPVAQTFGIGLIHIRDYRISLPALHFLLILRTVDDDTDGEEIVDALEAALLLLHLLPDAMDRLRTALDMTVDACSLHLFLYRFDKGFNIGITSRLRGIQFLTDHIVSIVLHILQ